MQAEFLIDVHMCTQLGGVRDSVCNSCISPLPFVPKRVKTKKSSWNLAKITTEAASLKSECGFAVLLLFIDGKMFL